MSLAEALYEESATNYHVYDTPSAAVDVVFLIAICIIHIIYASKFTSFSLGYLKAKLEEKKSRSKWSESKLYLHAVCCINIDLNTKDHEEQEQIYSKLWIQLSFIRYILRILVFVCCIIFFVLYLSFLLNIFYEYMVVCIVYYEVGSFLALIVLPFFYFINVCLMRFFIFSMKASWSINVDCIADNISYQQHHLSLKQYAHKDEYDNDSQSNITDADASQHTIVQKATFTKTLKGFFSDYFMAVHWRLCVVICSAIATIFAAPTFTNTAASNSMDEIEQFGEKFTDIFWCQLFLRYIVFAMISWMLLYLVFAITMGIYGLISTLSVFNDVLDEQLQNETNEGRYNTTKNCLLRVFCLMDAFMIQDKNICWRNSKFVIYLLFFISGILCIIIGSAINNGLIRFVGIINTLYYVAQILLICKIRGIHLLWNADMVSLELKNWWNQPTIDDNNKRTYNSTDSHAAQMAQLKPTHLRKLQTTNIYSEVHNNDDEDQKRVEDDEKALVILSVYHDNDDNNEPQEADIRSEEDVLRLYTTTHTQLYNRRKRLYEQKRQLIWYKNLCQMLKMDVRLLLNYFGIIFKLYKLYWFLILPYHYEIRPLSIGHGKSASERVANYNYQRTYGASCAKLFNLLWHGMRGIVCVVVFVLILFGLIFATVELHEQYLLPTDYTQAAYASDNTSHSGLYVIENHYPICQTKWNANLSVFDLASLAHMAYEVQDDPQLQIMSMQELMCLYFDRIPPQDLNTTDICSWQIIDISRSSPAFTHIRHEKSNTEVVFIRGTWTTQEMSQDIALFNEVALLQATSWVIPITTILPQSFIIRIVYFVSLFEGSINRIRARFDEPLFEYSYDYLSNTDNTIDSLYFIGHSLGGGISQIVAAQLYRAYKSNQLMNEEKLKNLEIKSFSLAAPGLVWGSRKFSIDVKDLYETATYIKPRHDIVSSIDKYGGLTQNLDCNQQLVYECHLTVNTICQLSHECNVYDSHNPKLIQTFCESHDEFENGGFFMAYANYSS